MLEILTVLFSSLAIIWARKTDIQQEIADEQSRRQLGNAFRHPKDKLDARLNHFHVRLLNVIGEGIHIPAFCLATSLAFSTAAFLVSLIRWFSLHRSFIFAIPLTVPSIPSASIRWCNINIHCTLRHRTLPLKTNSRKR